MTLEELTELGLEVRRLGWTSHLESLRRLYALARRGVGTDSAHREASLLAAAIGVGKNRLPVALRCPTCPQTGTRTTDGAKITLNLPDRWVSTCPDCGAEWVIVESALLRAAGAQALQVDPSPTYRVLKRGVDTLRIGVYFEWKPQLLEQLEARRTEAALKPPTPPVFEIGGVPHEVRLLPRSSTGAPYSVSLSAPDWDTNVSTWATGPKNQTPNLMCTFRSHALSDFGWQGCVARWRKVMVPQAGKLREPIKMRNGRISLPELVSRLDVHVDLEGWVLRGGALENAHTEASRKTCKETWYETTEPARTMGDARACSYEFGARGPDGLFCRIYRKDLQVMARPEASWVVGVWKAAGRVSETPVTRVEFEFGREQLKAWRLSKLETLERNLSDSMRRVSSEWLQLVGPHAQAWKAISQAFATVGD